MYQSYSKYECLVLERSLCSAQSNTTLVLREVVRPHAGKAAPYSGVLQYEGQKSPIVPTQIRER
jgi:hypothetical protein